MFHFKILSGEEMHLVSFCLSPRSKCDVPVWKRITKRFWRIYFCFYSKDKMRCTILVITSFSVKLSIKPFRGVSHSPGKLLGGFFPIDLTVFGFDITWSSSRHHEFQTVCYCAALCLLYAIFTQHTPGKKVSASATRKHSTSQCQMMHSAVSPL